MLRVLIHTSGLKSVELANLSKFMAHNKIMVSHFSKHILLLNIDLTDNVPFLAIATRENLAFKFKIIAVYVGANCLTVLSFKELFAVDSDICEKIKKLTQFSNLAVSLHNRYNTSFSCLKNIFTLLSSIHKDKN